MTTAVFEKRLRALEEEVKELKQVTTKRLALFPARVPTETKKKSKLSKGILAGLRDMKAGRVLGSFPSGKAMRRAFER